MKPKHVCPRCSGVVKSSTRRITLEQAITNHQPTCPGRALQKGTTTDEIE